jgi:hypothetical protein
MAKRLIDIKQSIYSGTLNGYLNSDGTVSNKLLDYLMANPGLLEKNYQKPDFIDTYSMLDSDTMSQNTLIDSWQELYDSNDKMVSSFARDLIYYAFITSGDNPGMNTFFKYLPNKIKQEIGYADFIEQKMADLQAEANQFVVSEDEIYLNNWQNDQLVKPVAYMVTE